jgi:hypothetical protein
LWREILECSPYPYSPSTARVINRNYTDLFHAILNAVINVGKITLDCQKDSEQEVYVTIDI